MNLSAEWLIVAPREEQAQELWIDAETKRQEDEAEELYALWLAEKAQKVHA